MLRFVLCWSHRQGLWDQRGVFHVYGRQGQPWLTVRLWYWMEQGTVDLWAYFLTGRYGVLVSLVVAVVLVMMVVVVRGG